MARRINYLQYLKSTHLYASITVLVFVLFYIVTGIIITQEHVFPHGKDEKATTAYYCPQIPDTSNHNQFLEDLKIIYEIEGRAQYYSLNNKGEIVCSYSRPGLNTRAQIANHCDSIYITTWQQFTVNRVASRLHFIRQFNGGWQYVIWGTIYDIVAIAFMLFPITGILIWIKYHKAFKFGWFIIIPTTGLAIVMVVSLL